MNFTMEQLGIILLIFLTGLSAGLCFTWSNAITPGIGKLDDLGYLLSFKQMNKSILNPMFILVFFGPTLLGLLNVWGNRGASKTLIWLLIVATTIYFIGVVLVTIFGNVPLNNMLESAELNSKSPKELQSLRNIFEVKWNRLHLIRTLSSGVSFLLLIVSLLQITKNNI